ncbi:MAG: hypothetical protein MK066_11890 [Crocinitomicaceae bacterium]|nr:hypothetical protein [Crocinitomicaceae bacterium]
MKKVLTLFIAFTFFACTAQVTPVTTPPTDKKVQLAILFDTSGSMDGLIEQAKSRIWSIVNEVGELRHNGQPPSVEIALYEYGNDGLPMDNNYLRQILPLTNDLDKISAELFALSTNGGSEFCGAVIKESLMNLSWSDKSTDLKMIYIAGNESFAQGPVDYKSVCALALKKNVFVNTIFCGSYENGVQYYWKDGATCAEGDYFNIDSDKQIVHIPTPYDDQIKMVNDSLNTTYFGYGAQGIKRKKMLLKEDANAVHQSAAVSAERSIAKSNKAVYNNSSWDLIDAVDEGKDITDFKEDELPKEFKGKTDQEKKALIEEKKAERAKYQTKIAELSKQRQMFIDEKMKERAEAGEELDDFGSSVNESIKTKAVTIGLNKEK